MDPRSMSVLFWGIIGAGVTMSLLEVLWDGLRQRTRSRVRAESETRERVPPPTAGGE
jgi:hypothetical protein